MNNMVHFTHCFSQEKLQKYRELVGKQNVTALAQIEGMDGECSFVNVVGCAGAVLGKYDENQIEIPVHKTSDFSSGCHGVYWRSGHWPRRCCYLYGRCFGCRVNLF